jgi:hypothetical protein
MDLNDARLNPTTLEELESFIRDFAEMFGREPDHDELRCLSFVHKLMRENQPSTPDAVRSNRAVTASEPPSAND